MTTQITTPIISGSPSETFKIGEQIGRKLKGNELILLNGDLGAGKTLLTKGIASAIGIDPEEVVSPSFTLINEFKGKNGFRLLHADLYRLGPSVHGNIPEIDDYIGERVIVIEWAQFLDSSYMQLPNSIEITFQLSPEDENSRVVTIVSSC
jgi:tRNA threonylcarbamoyladenosine biosynthesis protein TsaE